MLIDLSYFIDKNSVLGHTQFKVTKSFSVKMRKNDLGGRLRICCGMTENTQLLKKGASGGLRTSREATSYAGK